VIDEPRKFSDITTLLARVHETEKAAEKAMIKTQSRTESVTAVTDCVVFSLSFYAYDSIEFAYHQKLTEAAVEFLQSLPMFTKWDYTRLRQFHNNLMTRTYRRGDVLWRQGSMNGDFIAFIQKGQVSLHREVEVTEARRFPINNRRWQSEESTSLVALKYTTYHIISYHIIT
jgi:hypothetical protein